MHRLNVHLNVAENGMSHIRILASEFRLEHTLYLSVLYQRAVSAVCLGGVNPPPPSLPRF